MQKTTKPVWDYGEGGDIYPVQLRDIWRCGEHVFICADLQKGEALLALAQGSAILKKPTMMYSDPPWDQGNAKSFATKAGRPKPELNFNTFMQDFMVVASKIDGDVYVEMGAKHEPDMARWYEEAGIAFVDHWEITYYRKHPCWLSQGHKDPNRAVRAGKATGMDDEHTPKWAIERSSQPGDVVYEPCLGLGCTARGSQETGRVCLASELHPRRIAATIHDMVQKYSIKAEKIGVLNG